MPNTFLATVLHRFGVLHDLLGAPTAPRQLTDEGFTGMTEEALRFLIVLVTDLPPPSVVGQDASSGLLEPEIVSMRRTLVQFLVGKNRTHSELNA